MIRRLKRKVKKRRGFTANVYLGPWSMKAFDKGWKGSKHNIVIERPKARKRKRDGLRIRGTKQVRAFIRDSLAHLPRRKTRYTVGRNG